MSVKYVAGRHRIATTLVVTASLALLAVLGVPVIVLVALGGKAGVAQLAARRSP